MQYDSQAASPMENHAGRAEVAAALAGEACRTQMDSDGRAISVISRPVTDGEGVAGAVLLLDVTESAGRERLRREFTANVSHELKTPLTAISGYAEQMENGMAKPEDMPRFAARIRREAARLLSLIEDIIRLSRLDERKAEESERMRLDEIILAEAEVPEPLAAEKGVAIQTRLAPLYADAPPALVQEIAHNLIDNAVKYNKAGGRVTAALERQGEGALLTVRDTGIGIAQGEQERVFERF